MGQIGVGIIGTGWCGGIRAQTCAAHPLVASLHIAERPERRAEVAKSTKAKTSTVDYRDLLAIADIDAIYISATPETTHYPMARDCLAAGKHVFLEKPLALELAAIGSGHAALKPAAATPASAHCSSRSDVSPLMPTAPIA